MNRTGLALLLLLVILTRIPFITAGYGTDPDAWRVAETALRVWHTGIYEPSRLPGYPLHEIVNAPLTGMGGSLLSNSATLLVALLVLILWNHIALREARHPALLVAILAFTPLFWKNSAVTMDYVWSLLFILLAFQASTERRALMAGLFIGVAAGFRPGNAIAGAACMIPFLAGPRPVRSIFVMVTAACAVTAAAFVPVLLSMGVSGWLSATSDQLAAVRASQTSGGAAALYRGTYAFGPLAVAFIAIALSSAMRTIRTIEFRREPTVTVAIAIVLLFAATFLWLPMEREYLLPVLPFLLLALDRVCTRRQVLIAGALLVSFAFVNPDVVSHEGMTGHYQPRMRPGMVLEDLAKSHAREAQRAVILSARASHPTLIITGFPEPYWFADGQIERIPSDLHEQLFRNRVPGSPFHIYALSQPELAIARSQGYHIAVLRGSERLVEQMGGFSIAAEGITIVPPLP